jgi:GTP cyclohydrolase II
MPDVLNWLGITRIDRFISMSNLKHDAIARQGIVIGERVPIPDDRIPEDARVEMDAKKAAGYYSDTKPSAEQLHATKGRDLGDYEAV